MLKTFLTINFILTLLIYGSPESNAISPQSVEEIRINKAKKQIPEIVAALDKNKHQFLLSWPKTNNYNSAIKLINSIGSDLWSSAKSTINLATNYDDRPLYWQRLKLTQIIRTQSPGFKITQQQRVVLIHRLELASRGMNDLDYTHKTDKRILLTGFDPFLLDRNINQSNPSGVIALLLDGKIIKYKGITAEINTVLIPVRYKDFDQGLIEQLLAPFYTLNNVDLIATTSMGRTEFDLERYPGKRRSSVAPDNLNVYSGGTKNKPVISRLINRQLPGPEFIEFSLPVAAMMKARGTFKINDNHTVTTLKRTFAPLLLKALEGEIAVQGSGGGYLSNEISYRSLRLRNQLASDIPTGHIHTPRIKQYEPATTQSIVRQVENMLQLSLSEL